MNKQLSYITILAKDRRIDEARAKLETYLEDNPEDAQGWYLASFIRAKPELRLSAIQRAAKLQPQEQTIESRLMKLQAATGRKHRFPWLPIFAVILLIFVPVLIWAFGSFSSNHPPASNELPTLAVLQAALSAATQPGAASIRQNKEETAPTVSPALPLQMTSTEILSANMNTDTPNPVAVPTEVVQSQLVSSANETPILALTGSNSLLPLPTTVTSEATATGAASTAVSRRPTASPTDPPVIPVRPTTPSTTLTPGNIQVVPMDIGVNISAGAFRVVDATRGAESLIQNLGGSFVPAPTNQSWLLLELLIVCKDTANCKFDSSSLKVVDSTGKSYSYSPQLNLIPTFGTITQNNQIWGYLGFVVPTSDSALELTLTENGQTYEVPLDQG